MNEQSYIIRIYRRAVDEQGAVTLAGIVVIPETGEHEAFNDCHSLWGIITNKMKPGGGDKNWPPQRW